MKERANKIIKVSIIGIIMNVILTVMKMIVGLIVGAISIVLDAVNNLSDAISQIVTIIGTAFSAKAPDKKHPYGYGRIEYITGQIISAIIIGVGVVSLKEAIEKIITPSKPDYNYYTVAILIVAIVAKILYSIYTRIEGKKLNAQNLKATSTDSLMDSILTLSTLIAGLIVMFGGYNLEGYVGCLISLLIIRAGIELMIDAIKSIIGNRIDPDLSKGLKEMITSYDGVLGAYDLTLHEYGPSKTIGSVHIELDDKMNAAEIHVLTRKINEDVYLKYGIVLTIGIYATNDSSTASAKIKEEIKKVINEYDTIIELHGFYVKDKRISFDLVFDFACKDRVQVVKEIKDKLKEKYQDYDIDIVIDNDVSD